MPTDLRVIVGVTGMRGKDSVLVAGFSSLPLSLFSEACMAEKDLGIPFSRSEQKFFGGPKKFRHNILRYVKAKEI